MDGKGRYCSFVIHVLTVDYAPLYFWPDIFLLTYSAVGDCFTIITCIIGTLGIQKALKTCEICNILINQNTNIIILVHRKNKSSTKYQQNVVPKINRL